ncbi:hypothetical protein GA0070609_2041 [Micromonospora echinaurantiaca]|uniref:Glycosyl-4,4'-diaponeurosporenoate acyltransferase n=1 Tax=Micromonospora echinaurantiaca TaxID=47857 RepID=A0A1C5HQI5_9ACTN|nr:hypothetical protein [Micromonospora echinaurantiaca]SCG48242.1 hypothetical protein GA0070609_2041 [Micromonospora echinaurantiaca]
MTRSTLILLSGPVVVAAAGAATGALLGYGFAFAWVVHFGLMAWIAAWVDAARPGLGGDHWRIRRWEPGLYRRLGVGAYRRLLRRVGWERLMGHSFAGTRAALPALDLRARRSEFGHSVLAVVALGLAGAAALLGAGPAAGWLAGLTVPLHGYPIVLQRALRARIHWVTATTARARGTV